MNVCSYLHTEVSFSKDEECPVCEEASRVRGLREKVAKLENQNGDLMERLKDEVLEERRKNR